MAKLGASPKKDPNAAALGADLANLLTGCFSKDPKERQKSRTGCGCLIVLIIVAIIGYFIVMQSN